MTSLYTLRKTAPGVLSIIKLDQDWNPEASYLLTLADDDKVTCTCPASDRPTCRHRKMLPFFIEAKHVDDGWFFEWETRRWKPPIVEQASEMLKQPNPYNPFGSEATEPLKPTHPSPPEELQPAPDFLLVEKELNQRRDRVVPSHPAPKPGRVKFRKIGS